MKKEIVALVVCGAVLVCGACTNPKDPQLPKKKEQRKTGCGCQSSENSVDLRAGSENMGEDLAPSAKL